MSAAEKLQELIKTAKLFDGEHRQLAAEALYEVLFLQNMSEHHEGMYKLGVRERRKLLGLERGSFWRWLDRLFGVGT